MKEIVSAVTRRGQVTILAEVRQRLGLETPDRVAFVIDDNGVRLQLASRSLASLFGSIPPLPGREPSDDFDAQIAEAMSDEVERVLRETEAP